MAAYATANDLEARWRPLSDSEKRRAGTLLGDASVFVDAEFRNAGKSADDADSDALRIVCCNIVRRMMASSFDEAVSQASQTAGAYSFQATFANPNGDMYMTEREYRMLGISRKGNRITFANPLAGE